MQTFELSDGLYRPRRLSAFKQWGLLQAIAPVLGTMVDLAIGLRLPDVTLPDATRLLAPLAGLSEDALATVIQACCGACERQAGETWEPVVDPPRLADLTIMLVVLNSENFGPMYALERPKFQRTEPPYSYTSVTLPDGKDWLWRPIHRGYYRGESLFDGTLQIEHIAMANMALDVSDENEARARKAAETVK